MGARSVLINLLGDGSAAGRALRGVGDDADRAADRLNRLSGASVDVNGRLHDAQGRFLSAGADARRFGDDVDHGSSMLLRLMPAAAGAAKALGGMVGQVGMAVAAFGTAVPAAAALATTLVNVAPAAGVAATALVAAGLAGGALKIGMSGVGDAITAALDPTQAEAFNEALKKLSPNARAFALEVKALSPELAKIKTAVQDQLFENLDKSLKTAATDTLPIFRRGLVGASEALNGMARGVLDAASGLAKSGALGTAVDSATGGLKSLSMIPAQIVQGLVQVAAAAGPTFQKMTAGIAGGVTAISEKLSGAFKSGAMEKAINGAVALLKELVTVGANVGKILGNILAPLTQAGGGLIGVLRDITGAIAQVTASAGVQAGLKAIYDTMATLGRTVAPLLAQALGALGPVFAALGPPAQTLIQALGQALQPIIAALGPLLTAAATAVGSLVTSFAPLLPVIGQLISAGLAVLTPFISALSTIFAAWAPVVQQVADILTTSFAPILAQLPALATPLAESMTKLGELVLPLVAETLRELAPSFARLGEKVGELIPKVVPLIEKFAETATELNTRLIPALLPLITKIGEVALVLTDLAIKAIDGFVIPALEGLAALMNGDFKGAFAAAGKIVSTFVDLAIDVLAALPGKALASLSDLADTLAALAATAMAGFRRRIATGVQNALAEFGKIPGRIRGLFAGAGTWLVAAGASIINGLVAGVRGAIPSLSGLLNSVTNMIPDWKGPPEKDAKLLRPAGVSIMDGLIEGIDSQVVKLKGKLGEVTQTITHAFGEGSIDLVPIGDLGKKLRQALTKGADEITSVVKQIRAKINDAFKSKLITADQRDGLVDFLATTNKKLRTLAKERAEVVDKIKEITDYAKKITDQVLSYAAITQIKGDEGAAPTGGQLVAGLQARLATIREFGGNLKKLAQAGLSKALLGQILDAGIDGGAQIAAELANGPASIIAALNTTQTQITKIAKGIGIDGADALFGSGKAMGDAFLKGLKSLEKALVDSMELLVEKLLKALGLGVDKAKGKLAEMVETSAKLTELVESTTKMALVPYNPGPNPKAPTPLVQPVTPKATPVPQLTNNVVTSKGKGVTVNMGGVTLRDKADTDMLMNAVQTKIRGATF